MAAKKKATASADLDAYYTSMTKRKIAAGLSLADATEVVARQRAEDEANGVVIEVDDITPPADENKSPES